LIFRQVAITSCSAGLPPMIVLNPYLPVTVFRSEMFSRSSRHFSMAFCAVCPSSSMEKGF
jgi:hypothetical protein